MRLHQAKELFRSLTAKYFAGAEVTFSRQSRVAKPQIPLVSITAGNVNRPLDAVLIDADGESIGHYLSRVSFQIDLFTHGAPVADPDTGAIVAHENTAVDDMLSFADFLNSQFVIDWCHQHDVSLSLDGDVQDLTGLVNDNNYEYRSRLGVLFYFTQKSVGYASVLTEDSIQYPTGEIDPDTNEPIYSPEEPSETESSTGKPSTGSGGSSGLEGENIPGQIIIPDFEQSSSGGGSEELAAERTGYFTNAEIKEEKQE